MTTNVWILYYKGTGVQMPYKRAAISIWESTIKKGLKLGVSIKTQKENIKEDLDEMEQFLVKTFGLTTDWNGEDLKNKIGESDYNIFVRKWGMNIVSGLKLGIFKNDEMNGHLFIESQR